ncbi:metalloproteinase inhibitor 1 [Pelobates fuscus]|uniref:metalloproteinase inhibitor 1 n=1 Tax=Pelobates fuscus TaxID=191477 RepID=UPI002FE4A1AA
MFSILRLMIFGCLSQIALSCTCGPKHPQSAYCDSAVVIRAKFVGQSKSEKQEQWMQYEVKPTKVFKAPDNVGEIEFVHTAREDSMCGYIHQSKNRSEEFLITGYVVNNVVVINSCGFIAPWASLSFSQKRGFQQVYEKGCTCKIVPCYSMPCEVTSDSQCLWTDPFMQKNQQARDLACLDKGNGLCVWENQKYRLLTTLSKSKKH